MNMLRQSALVRRFDVAGTGFTVLDRIYADGALADEALGGSCANVLVSLAMLGHRVAPVLRLGADDAGTRLIDEFVRAGADVEFIARLHRLRSPILTEEIDTVTAEHAFSFRCPITQSDLPRYEPIGSDDIARAGGALDGCVVFYADRLTGDILAAMRRARRSGACVVFEPSEIADRTMFAAALAVTSILKSAVDRLPSGIEEADPDTLPPTRVTTHGPKGLELRDGTERIWCPAVPAPVLRDACGSGDMVTVGMIDDLLSRPARSGPPAATDIVEGVIAGQRLAAANCAYEGARGLFRRRNPAHARAILDGAADALT